MDERPIGVFDSGVGGLTVLHECLLTLPHEDFVYAVNAVAYKGCRVEVAGFRSNTAPRLIDVADFFIDLGEIAELIRKDVSQSSEFDVPSFVPPVDAPDASRTGGGRGQHRSQAPNYNEDEPEGRSGFVRIHDDQ